MPPDPVVLRYPETPPVRRILVGEDDQDLRDIIVGFLEAKGWAVVAVPNGPSALEHARREIFAFIILDVRALLAPGLSVLERVRSTGSSVPIIVITSFGDAILAERASELGANHVIEKPFGLEDLERAIERCSIATT
jgi:DNA-binding response OmpR family regulator